MTRTVMGARIAPPSTTTSSSTLATPVPVNPSGVPSQAVLPNSSRQANVDNDSIIGGSQMHTNAGTASRIVSKQTTAHSSSIVGDASALTTTPPPPADQTAAWAQDRSSAQENGNRPGDGSSGTFAQPVSLPASVAARDVPQPLPLSQSVSDPPERTVAPLMQFAPAPSSDGSVASGVQMVAPATPSGMSQAAAGIPAQVAGGIFTLPAELPMASALPGNGDSSQPAGKAAPRETNDAAGPKNPDLAGTPEPGKSKAAETVGTASDGSSHAASNGSQSTQHSQTAPSQAAAVAPKGMDSSASLAQAVAMHAVSHEAAPALRAVGGFEGASHQNLQRSSLASSESDNGDAVVTSGINTAKLIQTMNETGMSVGMRSSEFGNISIRTSVSQQQMLAQISLDHGDLGQAISAHVSSLQTKLENEYGLHTLIHVNHQGASPSGGSGNSAHREQNAFVRSARTAHAAVVAEPDLALNSAALVSVNDGNRLDIRA